MDYTKKQEHYDAVRAHLAAQGKKAEAPLSSPFDCHGCSVMTCVYLAPDGCRCAIGCLIPPALNSSMLDGSVESMLRRHHDIGTALGVAYPPDTGLPAPEDVTFLRDLQRVHDSYPVEEWPWRLANVAYTHRLVA